MKYIFVTGGVCSSLGKGTAASAIGALLEAYGYTISMAKIDPYLNVDAGTMSPIEHGEVYVTEDGAETDLDLGNYERFTQYTATKRHTITTGQVYNTVINTERTGGYLGKCIQMIPHVTDEIKRRIKETANPNTQIVIIEIGGTVGDIEANLFLEATRQLIADIGKENIVFVHITLILKMPGTDELKTKPTQNSVRKFREIIGSPPDILLCRTDTPIPPSIKKKLAFFSHIAEDAIIPALNLKNSIYELPLSYDKQGLSKILLNKLHLKPTKQDTTKWKTLIKVLLHPTHEVNIGIIGKYMALQDAYTSIYEALHHGGIANKVKVKIHPIDTQELNHNKLALHLGTLDGILVPGGFGSRGTDSKIKAIQYARKNNLPYLGICLGLQVMVIEYAQHVLKLAGANSTEFDPHTPHPIIHLLASQKDINKKGGTMRLGTYTSQVVANTKLFATYKTNTIKERHRHRYEVNNKYLAPLEKKGLIVSCKTQTKHHNLVEAVEWKQHPFGIGVQYHPEFKSKPFQPHPLFRAFIKAACKKNNK